MLALCIVYACGSDDEPMVDCSTTNLQGTANNIMDATCNQDNGSFELNVSGGSGPYELTISGSGTQSIQSGITVIENLTAGSYSLTIRDSDNCTATANVNISDVNNLMIESQIEASGCETANGTLTITATGGNEPYSYSLDGGAAQTDNLFSNLATGDYTALVTDADGCETSITVTVSTGVSYNDIVKPIIDTSCAISNCHDGSNAAVPNWTSLATVQTNANNIKTKTGDGSMPPAGQPDLTTEQIQSIACWVDDGALDN